MATSGFKEGYLLTFSGHCETSRRFVDRSSRHYRVPQFDIIPHSIDVKYEGPYWRVDTLKKCDPQVVDWPPPHLWPDITQWGAGPQHLVVSSQSQPPGGHVDWAEEEQVTIY